mmetsp:Transcript_99863/g.187857  ORF Transcript_99863/g.187857 Transcript_99863/m.187857 type:complete len:605 (+) Transcript_99863:81-1895(+)
MLSMQFLKSAICPWRKGSTSMDGSKSGGAVEQERRIPPHLQEPDQVESPEDERSTALETLLSKQESQSSSASTCSNFECSFRESSSASSADISSNPSEPEDVQEGKEDEQMIDDIPEEPVDAHAPQQGASNDYGRHTNEGDLSAALGNTGTTSLKISAHSWAARQQSRRSMAGQLDEGLSHEEVLRRMKSILNKLTVDKFPTLSKQLISCGIQSASHLEALTDEICKKAITQHHFVNMYADLCVVLHTEFSSTDNTMNFKKILLNACQASFMQHLIPPANLRTLTGEELASAEHLYKAQMLGNIKFIGALVVRKMLAVKVMLAIIEDFLDDPSSEALESLATLLTVVGPTFDQPESAHSVQFDSFFDRVEAIVTDGRVKNRVRCLLKDVLELRASGWQDGKPKKLEEPSTLEEVAQKFQSEVEAKSTPCSPTVKSSYSPTSGFGPFQVYCRRAESTKMEPWKGSVHSNLAFNSCQGAPVIQPENITFPSSARVSKVELCKSSHILYGSSPGRARVTQKASDKLEDRVREFVKANGIDENAARDLIDCPPEVQKMVMLEGEVTSAQNPSAKLRVRIKRAFRDLAKKSKVGQWQAPSARGKGNKVR